MAKVPQTFSMKMDASGPIALFTDRIPRSLPHALKEAAGYAAYQVQEIMRSELYRLIYSTPESPNYQRTWTLWRSTYASRPGANHSRDHDAAKAGRDLRTGPTQTAGLVRLKGFEAEIEVGSWANYAWHVHEGHGIGHRIPKPFTVKAKEEAPRLLSYEIGQALAKYTPRR